MFYQSIYELKKKNKNKNKWLSKNVQIFNLNDYILMKSEISKFLFDLKNRFKVTFSGKSNSEFLVEFLYFNAYILII
jgi:hypothetical protein